MQAKDQYVLSLVNPARSADELNVGPDRDRGCGVHAVVDLRRILIPRDRFYWQTGRERHLRVVEMRPVGNQTVDVYPAGGEPEIILRSPRRDPSPEKTHFGNLLYFGNTVV